jgi:type I restriction enzyme, S subunit
MKQAIVNSKELLIRADAKYHLASYKDLYESWTIKELKEIVVRDPNCYGFQYSQKGIPIIRISDLGNPFIDYTNVAYISPEIHKNFKKTHLKKYDILMSVRGVSIGKIGIFLGEYNQANISPNIIIIRLKDPSLAPYVAMCLVSSVGQDQIKRIKGGSSKPTINASFINEMKIPVPDSGSLNRINELFYEAESKRNNAADLITSITNLFDKKIDYTVKDKQTTYLFNGLVKQERWDSHYHNPKFQTLRNEISNIVSTIKLEQVIDPVKETLSTKYPDKVGYIEITHVDNKTASISPFKFDYVKILPKGTKIPLKDGDILVSKVRPYRNSITIFQDNYKFLVTASKNAFAVFRTMGFSFPYYITAFLRYYVGLNQIVMKQSGTSYPTVSEGDIGSVEVPIFEDTFMSQIDNKFKEYIETRVLENNNRNSILEIIELNNL